MLKIFLCDGQGAVGQVILYADLCEFLFPSEGDKAILIRNLLLKKKICSQGSKFFPVRVDLNLEEIQKLSFI